MLRRQPPVISVEAEVAANIKAQAIGGHTVGDLNLSDAHLRRIVDRVIRESFEERYRIVVADGSAPASIAEAAPVRTPADRGPISLIRPKLDEAIRDYRAQLKESRVESRGFRAPVLSHIRRPSTTVAPRSAAEARAADHVARRLALDGLLTTTTAVIRMLGADQFRQAAEPELDRLGAIGLPTDLLRCFCSVAKESVERIVQGLADEAAGTADIAALKKRLARREFNFEAARPGFVAASESGEVQPGCVRLQVPSGSYWGGVGAGGALDVARQLVEAIPGVPFLVFVEEKHMAGFAAASAGWNNASPELLSVVTTDSPVSQWAQDNSKAGLCDGRPCMLLPRYASRAEDGPTFVPGDTFIAEGLTEAGLEVSQSALLFQGGNVMMLARPGTHERLLLIGEGEVDRHVALGLTREQTIDAYRIEFGADLCEVVPAVSFHIDYELSVRGVVEGLVALVPDERAGAGMVLRCGLSAAANSGLTAKDDAIAATRSLEAGDALPAVSLLGRVLASRAARPGHVPESVAGKFCQGSTDSGVGNVQRILAAMDLITATSSSAIGIEDRHGRAYLHSLLRRLADRKVLHRQLERLRMRLVHVPSFGEGRRALTAINGFHTPSEYYMPAYGGIFEPLDAAAAQVIGTALGPSVAVRRVLCGETQRRAGALHCAVSVVPAPR